MHNCVIKTCKLFLFPSAFMLLSLTWSCYLTNNYSLLCCSHTRLSLFIFLHLSVLLAMITFECILPAFHTYLQGAKVSVNRHYFLSIQDISLPHLPLKLVYFIPDCAYLFLKNLPLWHCEHCLNQSVPPCNPIHLVSLSFHNLSQLGVEPSPSQWPLSLYSHSLSSFYSLASFLHVSKLLTPHFQLLANSPHLALYLHPVPSHFKLPLSLFLSAYSWKQLTVS